jgi:ribosomal protein S18 acetylase RimI-like enzyme
MITIRLATPTDFAAIERCARDAYAKYVERIGREPAPMVADFAAQIDDGVVHVAVDADGSLMGFAVFYPQDSAMHLENIAAATAHQGKGIGKALIAQCEAEARRQGFACVELYTNQKMTENLSLYPTLGYEEIGRGSQDGFDRVFYRKVI